MRQIFFTIFFLAAANIILPAQNQHILNSTHIPVSDTVWVFTPSAYDLNPSDRYPLVYLLHGWQGSYHQWNDIINCQDLADRYGFIIVCPDGLIDSWYINSPAVKQSQYADFFFQDLITFISATYRADAKNLFITGLSMGGHGALYLFAQKPDLFRSAGSLSGVLDLSFCWNEYSINDYLGIHSKESGIKTLHASSVTGNINKIAGSGKEIIFTCGSSDRFYSLNNQFKQACDESKVDATYIISPGGHDYVYWKSAIGYHFDFFSKRLK